jgi:hypothetical protein
MFLCWFREATNCPTRSNEDKSFFSHYSVFITFNILSSRNLQYILEGLPTIAFSPLNIKPGLESYYARLWGQQERERAQAKPTRGPG